MMRAGRFRQGRGVEQVRAEGRRARMKRCREKIVAVIDIAFYVSFQRIQHIPERMFIALLDIFCKR